MCLTDGTNQVIETRLCSVFSRCVLLE